MKKSYKIVLGAMAFACVLTVPAAELLRIKTAADFQGNPQIDQKNGVFSVSGFDRSYTSAKTFPVDPAKTYKLSASFRATAGTAAPRVYTGFVCLDKDGKAIQTPSVSVIEKTQTELAAPVKKGDKVVKVKDASKWTADTTYRAIAFNAKEDYSDLPNNSFLYYQKGGIAKVGNVWEIKLQKPADKDYAAGTGVREQSSGAWALYLKYSPIKADWVTLTDTAKGINKFANWRHIFWPGTKSVRVLIILNMGKGTAAEFKDIVLEEVE